MCVRDSQLDHTSQCSHSFSAKGWSSLVVSTAYVWCHHCFVPFSSGASLLSSFCVSHSLSPQKWSSHSFDFLFSLRVALKPQKTDLVVFR